MTWSNLYRKITPQQTVKEKLRLQLKLRQDELKNIGISYTRQLVI